MIYLYNTYGTIIVDGEVFYFDIEDLSIIQSRSWYKDKDGYLVHSYFYHGKRCFVSFHRLVMKAKPNEVVDHINHKRADNRKSNLRICKRIENDRNRGLYITNTSGIAGVHFDKQRNKWIASITYNNKKLFIGRFELKEAAIKARLAKEIELFQEFAPQKALLKEYI